MVSQRFPFEARPLEADPVGRWPGPRPEAEISLRDSQGELSNQDAGGRGGATAHARKTPAFSIESAEGSRAPYALSAFLFVLLLLGFSPAVLRRRCCPQLKGPNRKVGKVRR